MKFVDEVFVHIEAGNGGHGALSFRREKYVPRGGPDGGDGGRGGSVYLVANENINTLVEFRYKRRFHAPNGQSGMGRMKSGKKGQDLEIPVPIGTTVYDVQTNTLLGDLTTHHQTLCLAKGGRPGLGNANFKTSTNRAPRHITSGELGEQRDLKLELKVLADVGLFGMPNAGKSTLIRAISNAKPRVADYPFTTLYPNLGVVRVDELRSFVVADIPGLIEGASQGVGLGIQFLKHLSRTTLLLHVIDIVPADGADPAEQAIKLLAELHAFSSELAQKTRWLVFNKTDLLSAEEVEERCRGIMRRLEWEGPSFMISAVTHQGTQALCYQLMDTIEKSKQFVRTNGPEHRSP